LQLEIECELMAVDSAHLNQLFNSWTWQQGDDQSGFFYGVPAGSLLHQVTAGNSAPIILDFSKPTAGGIHPYQYFPSEYIFVKIDQLSCINEREFTNVPHPY